MGRILTARPVDVKARPITACGPEWSLGLGPLHAQARPCPTKAVSTFQGIS